MSDEVETPVVDIAGKLDEVGRSLSEEVKTAADALRAENAELTERLTKDGQVLEWTVAEPDPAS